MAQQWQKGANEEVELSVTLLQMGVILEPVGSRRKCYGKPCGETFSMGLDCPLTAGKYLYFPLALSDSRFFKRNTQRCYLSQCKENFEIHILKPVFTLERGTYIPTLH